MKKSLAILMGLLLLLAGLPACGGGPQGGQAVKAQVLAQPGQKLTGVSYQEVSDSFREALWRFADKSSPSVLAKGEGKNSLYSPMSLYYALAMLEAGSAGRTKEDLRNFLEVGDETFIGEELQKLYALMTMDGEGAAEQVANALWFREDLADPDKGGVKASWLDQLAHQFYAGAFAVDFADPKTGKIMSDWVSDQTRGKIKPKIDLSDPLLLMVLMNTVYFKADWDEPFSKENMVKDLFYAADKTLEDVTYLKGFFKNRSVLQTPDYKAGRLPLVNGHMTFVLPEEGKTPEDLLKDPDLLSRLGRGSWGAADLDIRLPKFTYRTRMDILKDMEALGLTDIVTKGPDFSAMLDLDAEVSAISQETFIALDEKGVEAAGYTEIMIRETSALPVEMEVLVLNLNRPFLYLITDQAGTPLFVGIIQNPLAE